MHDNCAIGWFVGDGAGGLYVDTCFSHLYCRQIGIPTICSSSKRQALEISRLFPLRGALIRVVNDGNKFPKVTEALAVTHDDTRGEDEDIVFATTIRSSLLPHKYELDLTLDSPEIIRMRQRCNNFVPGLEHAE
ncbi:hypothetical protein BDZ89DRAFT_1138103 [Hymenopellis radicata]|nr:hypothetical protein BDZ89DRAFT_1138103 [Hymenopellis radicata]